MSVTFVVVSVVLLCFRPIFPFSSFQPFLFIGGFHDSWQGQETYLGLFTAMGPEWFSNYESKI